MKYRLDSRTKASSDSQKKKDVKPGWPNTTLYNHICVLDVYCNKTNIIFRRGKVIHLNIYFDNSFESRLLLQILQDKCQRSNPALQDLKSNNWSKLLCLAAWHIVDKTSAHQRRKVSGRELWMWCANYTNTFPQSNSRLQTGGKKKNKTKKTKQKKQIKNNPVPL